MLAVIMSACTGKPSTTDVEAKLKNDYRNLIRVVTLGVKYGETSITEIQARLEGRRYVEYDSQIEWLDTVKVSMGMHNIVRPGEFVSVAVFGARLPWDSLPEPPYRTYHRGDRERISGRLYYVERVA